MKKLALSLYHYFCFFLLMAFFITCCMMLFLSTMSASMGIEFTEENINTAARLTFLNVMFLSLVCTVIDGLRRKFTVDRPVKKIVSAAERIAKGDYSVRIEPLRSINRADGLDKIAECYNKMANELEGTATMQSDFIANVSHELKTPLAVMQNYASLLSAPELADEERMRCARSVNDACRRLADLISNILKLSKLENSQIYPSVKKYDLSEQICESLLAFESIWEAKNIEISADIAQDVKITADPELLSVVWNNLISNALKFTEKGGSVSLSLEKEGGFAVVRVCDSGCGISPEVGRRIFDKFYQGDTSHATEGNGLGLALVKRIIEITEGDISVESTQGIGSTFTVRIKDNEDN